jgi:hypothetical protein
MSTTPGPIYSLLPAVFRTRDAQQGGQLQAYFSVLESQAAIVQQNVWQLYDDQFIETCAPWAIPYIGELIGFEPVYTMELTSPDSRAEVANTIGYRRRKGTLLALEQVTHDVSGRTTVGVEEFKRLITNLSLRDVRPHHADNANLRRGTAWEDQQGPFTRLNHTIDVRRIAPRARMAPAGPDPTPIEIAIHGPGRFNIPEVAVWMWRWQSWQVTKQAAFALGGGGYFFSPLGGPNPLFQQPPPPPAPLARLMTQADAPQPITRREFQLNTAACYPSSIALFADGIAVDANQIICANLTEVNGQVCKVPAGKIAIDPELGRIQFASDVPLPQELRVNYSIGLAAEIGGGPYNRAPNLNPPGSPDLLAVVGTAQYPTIETAVAAWNALPGGSTGIIVLPNYESYTVDLTGSNAILVTAQSQLLIAAAQVTPNGAPPEWNRSCVTLRGDIEVTGMPLPVLKDGLAAPMGQVQFSGIWLSGGMHMLGDEFCLQIADCTLTPGRTLTANGDPGSPGDPSLDGSAVGAGVCLTRTVTGPIALPSNCSARIFQSIVDAGGPFCPAFAGPGLSSAGATLHIENSTVIGRVWSQLIRLASNTIFWAKLGRRDPWKAPVWASQVQSGCVRFCWLPSSSIIPRHYECLPPNAASEAALLPQFITLRFGQAGYCMLSGDVPLAIWKGADNGSQMGVFEPVQETEAVTNIQIRSAEFLPANLECGVFLVPSRPCGEAEKEAGYGYTSRQNRCRRDPGTNDLPMGIGVALL